MSSKRRSSSFLVCGLTAVVIGFLFALGVSGCRSPRSHLSTVSNLVITGKDSRGRTVVKEGWRYGGLERLDGGRHILPFYRVEPAEDGDFLLRRANLLFIDSDLEKKRWLFPDNSHEIYLYSVVRKESNGGNEEEGKGLAVLYEIEEPPANAGNKADPSSVKETVYLSRLDGSGLTRIVENVRRVIDYTAVDDKYLLLFYVKENMGYAAKIDLSTFSVVRRVELAPLKPVGAGERRKT